MIRAICAWVLLAGTAAAQEACREDVVFLRGDWGQARFHVEIADDPQERAQGLMHREAMPMSAGMLFVFQQAKPRAFWMKNTLIPLDIVFFDARGVVLNVQAEAQPHDLTPRGSAGPTQFALEINGGLAASLGIGPGTELRHPAIAPEGAAWAC